MPNQYNKIFDHKPVSSYEKAPWEELMTLAELDKRDQDANLADALDGSFLKGQGFATFDQQNYLDISNEYQSRATGVAEALARDPKDKAALQELNQLKSDRQSDPRLFLLTNNLAEENKMLTSEAAMQKAGTLKEYNRPLYPFLEQREAQGGGLVRFTYPGTESHINPQDMASKMMAGMAEQLLKDGSSGYYKNEYYKDKKGNIVLPQPALKENTVMKFVNGQWRGVDQEFIDEIAARTVGPFHLEDAGRSFVKRLYFEEKREMEDGSPYYQDDELMYSPSPEGFNEFANNSTFRYLRDIGAKQYGLKKTADSQSIAVEVPEADKVEDFTQDVGYGGPRTSPTDFTKRYQREESPLGKFKRTFSWSKFGTPDRPEPYFEKARVLDAVKNIFGYSSSDIDRQGDLYEYLVEWRNTMTSESPVYVLSGDEADAWKKNNLNPSTYNQPIANNPGIFLRTNDTNTQIPVSGVDVLNEWNHLEDKTSTRITQLTPNNAYGIPFGDILEYTDNNGNIKSYIIPELKSKTRRRPQGEVLNAQIVNEYYHNIHNSVDFSGNLTIPVVVKNKDGSLSIKNTQFKMKFIPKVTDLEMIAHSIGRNKVFPNLELGNDGDMMGTLMITGPGVNFKSDSEAGNPLSIFMDFINNQYSKIGLTDLDLEYDSNFPMIEK